LIFQLSALHLQKVLLQERKGERKKRVEKWQDAGQGFGDAAEDSAGYERIKCKLQRVF
jgi:hypothetical protein